LGFRSAPFLYRAIFLTTLFALLFLSQRYWFRAGWRATAWIPSMPWQRLFRTVLVVVALAMGIAIVDRILFGRLLTHRGSGHWATTAAQLWVLPSILSFLLIKAVHAAEWSWRFALGPRTTPTGTDREVTVSLPRRHFFQLAAGAAGAAPLLAAVYGFARERLQFTVHRVEVPVANLPLAFDGLRIVQLSDLHIGAFMPRE
jgi:hypothetical protein